MWRANEGGRFHEAIALADHFKQSLTVGDCPIHFAGLWDTVSSVGWFGSPVSFPHTKANTAIAHIRHAVAIDERRAFFRTNLIGHVPGQDALEVWFPGTHCDVGGGYAEADSGMSKYPLGWMIAEARTQGMLVDEERVATVLGERGGGYAKPRPDAVLHNSMTGFWPLLEIVPKKHWSERNHGYGLAANLFGRRDMGATPVVHPVAWTIPGYVARVPEGARPLA